MLDRVGEVALDIPGGPVLRNDHLDHPCPSSEIGQQKFGCQTAASKSRIRKAVHRGYGRQFLRHHCGDESYDLFCGPGGGQSRVGNP